MLASILIFFAYTCIKNSNSVIFLLLHNFTLE